MQRSDEGRAALEREPPMFSPSTADIAVIAAQTDFGALLELALEVEAAGVHSEKWVGLGGKTLAAVQDSSSLNTIAGGSSEEQGLPHSQGTPSVADAHVSAAPSNPAAAPKAKGQRKGKLGRLNRKTHHLERRDASRKKERKARSAFEFNIKAKLARKHSNPETVHVDYRAADFPANHNGYTATPQKRIGDAPLSLQEAKDFGLKIIPWEGKKPMLVADIVGYEIGHFLGQPQDPGWENVISDATRAFERAGKECGLKPRGRGKKNNRGDFMALSAGVTHAPQSNKQGPRYRDNVKEKDVVDRLVATPSIQRLAAFASQSLAYRAPKVFKHYVEHLKPIYQDYKLQHLFPHSIFPSATFNLGPHTVCCIHTDPLNCPYGFCAITALGNYDPKKGGHLILWELGFAIEFPPGSTILIPSACIRHGNTALQPGETRFSFTQYCPGSLIQWHRCGNRNVDQLTREEILAIDGPKGARREQCLQLLSKRGEAATDQELVAGVSGAAAL